MKQTFAKMNSLAKFGLVITTTCLALIAAGLTSRSEPNVMAETPQRFQLARWNEQTQIFGARLGNPWINVRDGKEVVTNLAGAFELRAGFQNNESSPFSVATADFDEDGLYGPRSLFFPL